MEYTYCVICEINNSEFFYDKERNGNFVNFVICKECGLVYQNPRKTQDEFEQYYQSDFRNNNLSQEDMKSYIDSRVIAGEAIYKLLTSSNNEFIKDPAKYSVLDIGCGVGGILIPFKRLGFQCVGIDTPSYYTNVGVQQLGVDIKEVFLSDYRSNEKFDIVILNHVLEHLLNPVDDLRKIRSLLKTEGYLYIEVPDIRRPYSWTSLPYFFMLGHVYYFSENTITALLNKCGYKIEYIESLETPFMRVIARPKVDDEYEVSNTHYRTVHDEFLNRLLN